MYSKSYFFRFFFLLFNPFILLIKDIIPSLKNKENKGGFTKNLDVLTEDGWKPIPKITKNDVVAVLTDNTHLEYEKVSNVFTRPYEGKIYKIDERFVGLETTPYHFIFCFKSRVVGKKKGFSLIPAKDLHHTYFTGFKKTAVWDAPDFQITLPETTWSGQGGHPQTLDEWELTMEPFLKFFGFYIAEGWVSPYSATNSTSGRIEISQSRSSIHREFVKPVRYSGKRCFK